MALAVAHCVCKVCGKEFTKETRKKTTREATSWEEWVESHIDECDECKEARIAKEIAEENRINREFCEKLGLPDLVGTEKQIAYANTKRANWFRACFRSMRYEEHEYAEYAYDEPDKMEFNRTEYINSCKRDLAEFYAYSKKNDASFWLDGRPCYNIEDVDAESIDTTVLELKTVIITKNMAMRYLKESAEWQGCLYHDGKEIRIVAKDILERINKGITSVKSGWKEFRDNLYNEKVYVEDVVPSIFTDKADDSEEIGKARIAGPTKISNIIKVEDKVDVQVLTPSERTHDGVVEIGLTDNKIKVFYKKDDDFRNLVKSLDYSWSDGCWVKYITKLTGSISERAAELGNKLLTAGYAVRIADPAIRKSAVNAEYEPECRRWVLVENDEFVISHPKDDRLYNASRKIPTSRYERYHVRVKKTEFKAVLDYAEQYAFCLTSNAEKLVAKMQGNTGVIVKPAKSKEPVYEEHNVLNSSREVLEDLKDD